MESYLRTLAKHYAQHIDIDTLQTYAFVFPNRRAGLFFRRYLSENMSRATLAPKIMTINDCFYQLSDKKLADPIDLLFRVWEAYRHVQPTRRDAGTDSESFDKFLFWGKMMVGDFSEIDNHLVENVKELFTTIKDLKEIDLKFDYLSERQKEALVEFWGDLVDKNKKMEEQFLWIWQALWPTYVRLREGLEKDNLGYDGQIHREIIESWESRLNRLEQHYVFIGFHTLTRSEQMLVDRLTAMGRAEVEHTPKVHINGQDITLVSVNSTVGETHEVYRILDTLYPKEHLQASSTEEDRDFTRTAVVLPDERMLLPMLRTIPEQIDKVNVTMGYPLSATPIFALLKQLENLRAHATEAGFYHKDVKAVLGHHYLQELCNSTWICDKVYVKTEDLGLFADAGSGIIATILDKETPVIPYLRRIISMLPEKNSEDIYLVETGLNRIERLIETSSARLQENGDREGYQLLEKTIFQLITLVLGDQSIPYAGEPLEGLQVMGVLETRALDFDNVIITGFNDDLYPGKSRGNSFIPHVLRRGFGLPTPERLDEIFTYNFYRMLTYAKRVWLITNTRADDQHSGEPSRFLAQLRYLHNAPIRDLRVVSQSKSQERLGDDIIEKSEAVMQELNRYTQGRLFSASAIKSYLRCPKLFYWKKVANIKEPEEIQEELDSRQLGTLLHGTMEAIYAPHCQQIVNGEYLLAEWCEQENKIEDTIRQVATAQKIEIYPLAIEVVKNYVMQILKQDALLGGFRYVASEKEVKMELLLRDGRKVQFVGYIDRIDEIELDASNGPRKRLVDYKTGEILTEFKNVEDLFNPNHYNRKKLDNILQTILYSIMEGGEPHLYGMRTKDYSSTEVRMSESKQDCSENESASASNWLEKIRAEFLSRLTDVVEEILNPNIPFTPATNTQNCNFCPMKAMCRVADDK